MFSHWFFPFCFRQFNFVKSFSLLCHHTTKKRYKCYQWNKKQINTERIQVCSRERWNVSVYQKENPYLLLHEHWNLLHESFCPWYHILCFKLNAIIISVFHVTVLLRFFFLSLSWQIPFMSRSFHKHHLLLYKFFFESEFFSEFII